MLFIPLIMSTGVIGLVQYMGYWFPDMNDLTKHVLSLLVVLGITVALYRRISAVGKLATVLFIVMIVAVLAVTAAGLTQFSPHRAFDYPPHAFALGGPFFAGLRCALALVRSPPRRTDLDDRAHDDVRNTLPTSFVAQSPVIVG